MGRVLAGLWAVSVYLVQIAWETTAATFIYVSWLLYFGKGTRVWLLRLPAYLLLIFVGVSIREKLPWLGPMLRSRIPYDAELRLSAAVALVFALACAFLLVLVNVMIAWTRGLRVAVRSMQTLRAAQAAPDAPPKDAFPILLHISDLHIASPGREPFELEIEPEIWKWSMRPTSEYLCSRLRHIIEMASKDNPDLPVLITGDITDTGADDEWKLVLQTLQPFAKRMILAPGNHDISINRAGSPDIDGKKKASSRGALLEQHRAFSR